jgi:transglycosylase-like protein with SLT domain
MRENHARLVGRRSSVPPSILPSRPCSSMRRRSSGLQRKSHTRELPRSTAWLRSHQAIARIILAIATILCQIAVSAVFVPRAGAQIATRSESNDQFAKSIAEASARFAVPERWIRAVMQVESGGGERAISSRGALGLMHSCLGPGWNSAFAMGSGWIPSILATTSWRAPHTSRRCMIASGRLPCGL